MKHLFHADKLLRVFGSIAALGLVLFSLVFAYAMLGPIDVLKNWSLSITQDTYQEGDTVAVISVANKVMDVSGASQRSLICTNRGTEQQYDLPNANANRQQGVASKEIDVIIPTNVIPNLPQKCQVQILITYFVYGFRRFPEIQRTKPFTVLPREQTSTTVTTNTATATTNGTPTATATQTTQTTSVDTPVTPVTPVDPPLVTSEIEPQRLNLLGIDICVPFTNVCVYG